VELGLGLVEIRLVLLAAHEVACLRAVPRALRFVEQHHVIDWGPARGDQTIVAKVMHVLDKHAN
jgi:hypothetical protein